MTILSQVVKLLADNNYIWLLKFLTALTVLHFTFVSLTTPAPVTSDFTLFLLTGLLHFQILQSISRLSVDRNENEKMWVLLIKIVVTKYPRDKWYQFNAGNILRIQHREGKTITNISLAVTQHPAPPGQLSVSTQLYSVEFYSVELHSVECWQAVCAVSQCRRRGREAPLAVLMFPSSSRQTERDFRIVRKLLTTWQKRKFEKFLNWIFRDKHKLKYYDSQNFCIFLLWRKVYRMFYSVYKDILRRNWLFEIKIHYRGNIFSMKVIWSI